MISERWGASHEEILKVLKEAENCSTDYCFPNKLEDILCSDRCAETKIRTGQMHSITLETSGMTSCSTIRRSAAGDCGGEEAGFAITWRNLSLAYYNKRKDPEKAKAALEKAAELAPNDARIFLELDQLYRKLEMPVAERLSRYEKAKEIFMQRDDLMIEYVTLLNLSGHYKEAYDFIMAHRFHPWEGGEGKVTTQYTTSPGARKSGNRKRALERVQKRSLRRRWYIRRNLGEGKLEGTKDNHIHYYLGLAKEHLGRTRRRRKSMRQLRSERMNRQE